MEKKYKILKYENFDEYGKRRQKYYYIKQLKSFLGLFNYWSEVGTERCYMGDCVKHRLTFSSVDEAEEFAQNYICGEKIYDQSIETEVKSYKCK
jgi:hypothetical protein